MLTLCPIVTLQYMSWTLEMHPVQSVAIIGCGPAGAISIDALVREGAFDKVTVFERREKPGGCWSVNHANSITEVETVPGSQTQRGMFSTYPTSTS